MTTDDGSAATGVSDAEVAERLRGGEPEACRILFERYAQAVYGYCWRRLSTEDAPEAEDAMSLVFLHAWAARERLVLVDGSLRPWLLGVATNVLRNRRRASRRYAAALARFRASEAAVEPDFADDAIGRIDASDAAWRALEAIRTLSAKERDIAELCLVEGISSEDAARLLSIPSGTARSRLARARKHLQRVLRTGESSDGATTSGHLSGERAGARGTAGTR